MKIGYCRISTNDQSLNSQLDLLRENGCEKLFYDTVSGTKIDREGLNSMFDLLREGDIVVVSRLDRLARSLKDLISITDKLKSMGVNLNSISEKIDTTSSTGNLIFQIIGAFAEFERNIIRERTKAGLESARSRGRLGGRPTKKTSELLKMLEILYKDSSIPVKNIAKQLKISQTTMYNYLREMKKEKEK